MSGRLSRGLEMDSCICGRVAQRKKAAHFAGGGPPAAFDSEHDENLGLTPPEEKKLKITNYPRFAFT